MQYSHKAQNIKLLFTEGTLIATLSDHTRLITVFFIFTVSMEQGSEAGECIPHYLGTNVNCNPVPCSEKSSDSLSWRAVRIRKLSETKRLKITLLCLIIYLNNELSSVRASLRLDSVRKTSLLHVRPANYT